MFATEVNREGVIDEYSGTYGYLCWYLGGEAIDCNGIAAR